MSRPFFASVSCWIETVNKFTRLARSIEDAILAFAAVLGCLAILILMAREIVKLLGIPLP
jgi:hypothetical protein